jgi:hypothetical protein
MILMFVSSGGWLSLFALVGSPSLNCHFTGTSYEKFNLARDQPVP